MLAIVRAVAEQPHLNALCDDEAGIVHQHEGVHIGIAAQTPLGLMVPVVRHAEVLNHCASNGNLYAVGGRSADGAVATVEE
jgi:2-oxoisovalerate dehydrogenase E2 component (dihydrolipoyl transacylase)